MHWRVLAGVADVATVAGVVSVAALGRMAFRHWRVRVWAVEFFVVWMYLICCGKGVNLLSV